MTNRTPKHKLTPPPSLPENANWIESDRYDRHAYGQLRHGSNSLTKLEHAGQALVPHFPALLQDIFCLLFKYNIVFVAESNVVPSAAINRVLLEGFHDSEVSRILREITLLDEARTGLCTLLIGEGLLAMLTSEKPWTRHDMMDTWKLQQKEEAFQKAQETLAHTDELSQQEDETRGKDSLTNFRKTLTNKLRRDAVSIRQKQQQLTEDLNRVENEVKARVRASAIRAAQQLEQADEEAGHWSSELGSGGPISAEQRLELGRRLAGNDKLRKLIRMVGRMKSHALALRKHTFERANEELYSVEQGGVLERLLPQELIALHHPLLHRDFQRRLVENELLQYALRGTEQKRKGPVVVCLDGSSSMSGEKELWSKAVTLTLLELTRRQRRPFRSICFSSRDAVLQILDMNTRPGYDLEAGKLMDLAEHFPGGGTDFETPLDAALDCLGKSRYKKGDIVFITDGECQISPEWSQRFLKEKKRLSFSLFSVLIDMGHSSLGTLKEFSDRITTITQLTNEGSRELFIDF